MQNHGERALFALVGFNMVLQVLDGVATYLGVQVGYHEGNPLIAMGIAHLGAVPALVLFKTEACVCLLGLWHLRRNRLAVPALLVSAAAYVCCALAPWTLALAQAQLPLYFAS
jgi:hypothetical protein